MEMSQSIKWIFKKYIVVKLNDT